MARTTTAQTYIDWLRRTLAEPRGALSLAEVRDALAARRRFCLGAMLPEEHVAEIAEALLPELDARMASLGCQPKGPSHRVERSPPELLWKRVAALPAADAPSPFVRRARFAVGGLLSAGFAPNTELALVVSWNGKGVFDCTKLERVGRDASDLRDLQRDSAIGIAPIAGVSVPQMGADFGVALSRVTADGWSLGVLDHEDHGSVWLCAPGIDPEQPSHSAVRFDERFEEIRVVGFSPSGQSLIIGEPHTLHIYSRYRRA